MPSSTDLLWQAPALRPLAPLVLSAWEDGGLTPAELLSIREALERGPWLTPDERAALHAFLDPEQPPSPQALRALQRAVGGWLAGLPRAQRRSLSSLGVALAERELGAAASTAARSLLEPLESRLTIENLPRVGAPTAGQRELGAPQLDVAAVRARLDGDQRATRDEVRRLLEDPQFRHASDLSMPVYREQVVEWCRALSQLRLFDELANPASAAGGDVGRIVAAFETLACFDLSLVVKFGVQYGLFGGAIAGLGTAKHRELLPAIGRAELLGCFAMTERAHGSNVRDLQTVGRYDPATREFVIDTPSLKAGKEWIGGAALHARMAVVFGQLETQGESYGVHAWLVPIRDAQGAPLPGVRIEDCGTKMGLNGVDNGRLWFSQVRVPRAALLDRFGQVAEDGTYSSRIPSGTKRFFTMLGVLVGGRISVAGGALSASKVGLAIAIRYAEQRRQFPNAAGEEKLLFDYLSHQRRLLPRLAAACAFSFAQNRLVQLFAEAQGDEVASRKVDMLAAGLKALGTWQAIDTLQQCRECCGGQGYLTSNRIDALRTDTDVFTTFEGDNTVLLQLVAKELLGRRRRALELHPVRTIARSVTRELTTALREKNPVAVRRQDPETLLSPDYHARALRHREESLLESLLRRIAKRTGAGMDVQEAFEACQDHALALARAHVERFVHTAFREGAAGLPPLEQFCTLYGLWRLEADLAWFLEDGYIAPDAARAVRKELNQLLAELRPQALGLMDAFGIPASCLGPLADPAYLRASGLA